MIRDFLNYEQSLALKELGYREVALGYYGKYHDHENIKFYLGPSFKNSDPRGVLDAVDAPLYSEAFRWFRENYKLLGTVQYFTSKFYCYTINDMKDNENSNRVFTEFKSFEEAQSACIDTLIRLVKELQN